jgi:hypothetical protein
MTDRYERLRAGVEGLAARMVPGLSGSPKDCTGNCWDDACDCSGDRPVLAWSGVSPDDIRALLAECAEAGEGEAHCPTCNCGCTCGYGGLHEPLNARCALFIPDPGEAVERCKRKSHSYPEGDEPCDCAERLAGVTTHTRTRYGNDPAHCQECSAAIQEWVTWPCDGSSEAVERYDCTDPDCTKHVRAFRVPTLPASERSE